MWQKELEVAEKCAIDAGKAILAIYDNSSELNIEFKKDSSPLTAADKTANEIIVKALREAFPTYAILSEEEKDSKERLNNDFCFIVDPLDGTKEFIKKNGQFTVNIALSYKHKVEMGVILVPVTGELFFASKGEGAFLINNAYESVDKYERIHVSDIVEDIRCVMSSSHGCAQMDALIEKYNIVNFVKMGSSLKGCIVAKGDAEIYYRHNPTMEWDTAAMQCIVEEAGGIFKQMDGSDMLYNRENSLNDKGFYVVNSSRNILV